MIQNQDKKLKSNILDHVDGHHGLLTFSGTNHAASIYLIYELYLSLKKTTIVVADTSDNAKKCVEGFKFFNRDIALENIIYFPSYNIIPAKNVSYHNKLASQRIACLYELLAGNSKSIIVTDICGLCQTLIPRRVLAEFAELIEVNEEISPEILAKKLFYGGYKHVNIVEESGDFSVKNEIIDFFPPMYENPIRIEFDKNFIKSIRIFAPVTQRSIATTNEITMLPARETIFKEKRLMDKIRRLILSQRTTRNYYEKIAKDIKNNAEFSCVDKLMPLVYDNAGFLFDYIPDSAIFVTLDRSRLFEKSVALKKEIEFSLDEVFKPYFFSNKLFLDYSYVDEQILSMNPIDFKISRNHQDNEGDLINYVNVNCFFNDNMVPILKESKINHNCILPLTKILLNNKLKGYLTIIACNSEKQAMNIIDLLSLSDFEPIFSKGFPSTNFEEMRGKIYICTGHIDYGFTLPEFSIAVITYDEIFGIKSTFSCRREYEYEAKGEDLNIASLKDGEFVVHDEHGVGKYTGLVKLDVSGISNDFLVIIYRYGDKLYLPVDKMTRIQKYMAGDERESPVLSKMGDKTWERLKNKARSSTRKIARSLLQIYASRKAKLGYSFSCDVKLLSKFESRFPHQETQDQLKAIIDVLEDMKRHSPMDRLICGDVGYGKTEIALRASFVAASEKKQVAVLVPTTVLAEQHFKTFSDRFKGYTTNIACLSRFRSQKEQKNLIKKISIGNVDIVIGTHRLLQDDISFFDLGLVILDEEQRFGVEHKEKFKKLRTSIDVLALTATPIPRTLYLSLMGIRDISIIATPPGQRQSIISYICEFDYPTIVTAVRREIARKGQVFFIHNSISTIQSLAQRLKSYIPEIKINIAHGQMCEKELERVMLDFASAKIDMLVCTTIIESGLDIAGANTIIINRADKFGLAQIYQMRGRVGRSDKQAYAFLFVPKKEILTLKATKRLKVLIEHSDLGSGFQIAMNDMKIRGGGTILGASQSGHIASIGYDMFLKLIEESVAELKGYFPKLKLETEVKLPLSTFISEKYVADIDERLSMYRKLAEMNSLKEVGNFKEELLDRFGLIPEETNNLLTKVIFKILAMQIGVKRMEIINQKLILNFSNNFHNSVLLKLNRINIGNDCLKINSNGTLKVKLKSKSPSVYLFQIRNILLEIMRRVKG